MDQILQQVVGSQMTSLLDGFFGYKKIHLKNTDKFKVTFTTHWDTFYYECMPFGLINSTPTFHTSMQLDFDNLIRKIIQIYLNDLNLYSKHQIDHFDHLRRVLL